MAYSRLSSRPRRLRVEDDGVSVPWMSSLLGVYCVAMLNTTFWTGVTALLPYTGLDAVLFNGMLFVALAGAFAFVFNIVLVSGIGKALAIVLLLVASLGAYLLDTLHIAISHEGLEAACSGSLMDVVRLPMLWKVGLFGIVPAAALAWARIGTRRLPRECLRRVRYAVLCLAVIICAIAVQQRQFQELWHAQSSLAPLLNPVNVGLLLVQ